MGIAEKKRKRKELKQLALFREEEKESQAFSELLETLETLEKEGKYVDVQICPRCKSPLVRRVRTMSGDLWGHMGIFPSKFECEECGWVSRLVLKATNRPLSIKDIAIIAEALDLKGT